MKTLRRALAAALAMVLACAATPAPAASLTPPNLTQATTIDNVDLLLVWPTGTGGPLEGVPWSVAKALMTTALGSSYLQTSNNLSDLLSPSTARGNLGLGTAATQNTGSSGAAIPLLSGGNTWGAKQTFVASATGGASITLPHGVAPTSPVNGDLWTTSAGLFARINGVTQTVGTGTVTSVATNNGLTGGTITSTGTIGLAAIAANTGLINATAGSAVPTATALPSCSATGSALQYTTSSGFGCATGYAPLASPAFTGSPTVGGSAIVVTTDSRFGGVTQNPQCTYTLVLADAGKQTYCNTAGTHTLTIPANASVAFAVGTKIDVINDCSAGALTIAITTDTMVWFTSGGTGSRTLSACGEATLSKVTSTRWAITGTGLT